MSEKLEQPVNFNESTDPKKPMIYEDYSLGQPVTMPIKLPGFIQDIHAQNSLNETYRSIKWELLGFDKAKTERSLLVLSANAKEGKSSLAYNLALMMSLEIHLTSILVDTCDSDHSLTKLLGLEQSVGLTDYLQGSIDIKDCIVATQVKDFYVVPLGSKVSNRSELLASDKVGEFVQSLKAKFSPAYIIFDSKPVLGFADHKVLAPNIDKCLLAVQSGKTTQSQLDEVAHAIDKDKLAGVIMTQDLWKK